MSELSTHVVEVVPIKLYPHGNADSLSIVYPFGEDGYTCVVKTADWQDKTMGAYIPPDNIVPDTPEFAFLDGHRRIKVKKYRGIISQGLMWTAPEGSKIGDNVAEIMGVTHYNPAEPSGDCGKAPALKTRPKRPTTLKSWMRYLWFNALRKLGIMRSNNTHGAELEVDFSVPDYDIDSFFRYPHILEEGEEVYATEKIDGSNGRWVCIDNELYAGSHHQWKQRGNNAWWRMYEQYPGLRNFVINNPGVVVFGEIFGPNIQKDMDYGLTNGEVRFRAFDLWNEGKYWDIDEALEAVYPYGFPWVSWVYRGPFDVKKLIELGTKLTSITAERKELAEGIVVRPVHERYHRKCGRVIFKIVSPEYMDKHEPKRNKKK